MFKKVLLLLTLISATSCSNEVIPVSNDLITENVQAQATKTPVKNSATDGSIDISPEVVNKVLASLDINKDNAIDAQEVHVFMEDKNAPKGYITNNDSLDNKPLPPVPVNVLSSGLLSGKNILLSFGNEKPVSENLLKNLAVAFEGDAINNKKVKVYSTHIPYLAIMKSKTLVASLNTEQLAKKLNDGLSGIGYIEIMSKSRLISNKERSRIRFSIYETLNKKLPMFSSNTYSDAKID